MIVCLLANGANRKGRKLAIPGIVCLLVAGPLALSQENPLAEFHEKPKAPEIPPHMPESIRASISKVVVVAGQSPTPQEITGSYEQAQPGLVGGMDEGSRVGTISKDIGPVPVGFRIPVISNIGALFGGLSGAAKKKMQDFRDALTDELASGGSGPLKNDGVALDAFWALRDLPNLESQLYAATTPVPGDTDAVLYIGVNGVEIDVQGNDAVITTSAGATLRRLGDNRNLYETVIKYQDRDSLDNWTANDRALWRDYANYARHYLGRAVAADLFRRVDLEHTLGPEKSETVARVRRDERRFRTESVTPTLAWSLELEGGKNYGPWAESITESDVFYDVEIYDAHQLVYGEEQVPDPLHTVLFELEPCKTYYWSVRPSYRIDGTVKYGDWMRFESEPVEDSGVDKGLVGRQASSAPAYIQDFPELEIECRRR